MTPATGRPRRSLRAIVIALAFVLVLPASSLGGGGGGYNTEADPYLTLLGAYAPGGATPGTLVPLINPNELFDGVTFPGIPDGLGAVPGVGYVDLYVAHEESHVPFGRTIPPAFTGYADYQDSSVTRVRVDTSDKSIIEMEVVLSGDEGLLRFCSAFMAGPEHGFPNYTFFVNEESNEEVLEVPPGAVYGPDPFLTPYRQAGYSVWLDTETGAFDVMSRAGRHNHENTVVVPGGWNKIAMLSGDDTFAAPSSQLYLYLASNAAQVFQDKGQLFAFQVTATDEGPVDPYNAQNHANDFLEITNNESAPWSGRFIHVPTDIARGVTDQAPQTALETWSNANNVFQFVRVEDVAYDPENPRVVYFADTGTDRLQESTATGRLFRGPSGTGVRSNGRIFRMVLNEADPRIVDEFSVFAESNPLLPGSVGPGVDFVNPDNLDVGEHSIMVQEDSSSQNDIWRYDRGEEEWIKVATALHAATSEETSGIITLENLDGFGPGWWALSVQSHDMRLNVTGPFPWTGGPSTADGDYYKKIEDGQLLLMHIPGS